MASSNAALWHIPASSSFRALVQVTEAAFKQLALQMHHYTILLLYFRCILGQRFASKNFPRPHLKIGNAVCAHIT
jgi:hypothetical protein